MGRHSSPEKTPFIRSLGAWALPWLLILAVVAVALLVVMDMVSNDPVRTAAEGDDPAVVATDEDPVADDPQEKAEPGKEDKGDKQTAKKEPKKPKEPKEAKEPKVELITKDVQVQVLNGTAATEADDLMADKLARLGYAVVAVSPSSKGYPVTTVFWTGESQEIGDALAQRFGWVSQSAPTNLSSEVELHVVVGEDEI